MPTPQLRAIARQHGIPLAKAEEFWAKAKREYDGDWGAVVGTVKKMAANMHRARRERLAR